ncbi:LPXTG cell wall anchor domain-containing protein [Streptococcus sp. X16XC17]|nr:LPXTG cell wall anchor domain-containing protein [Streptococcus sp. X16XC17]
MSGIYRWVGGQNTSALNMGGLGGYGVKYDNGFTFNNGQFQPIVWQTGINADFDYHQGVYDEVFARVIEITSNNAAIVQPLANTSHAPKMHPVTPKAQLPATGDNHSILIWIGMALAITTGLILSQGLKKEME